MKLRQTGFTLFELMVGLTITGILVSLAVPSFQEYGRNTRVTAAQNDLITALNYGRSEAIRRATPVSVCSTSTFDECGNTAAWPGGWFAFLDTNGDGTRQDTEDILQQWRGPGDGNVAIMTAGAGAERVTFTATGLVQPTAVTKTYLVYSTSCESGTQRARRIQVNGIGSIRNDRIGCP
ncbi:MAG: GspH/FimT family pseudopilin [Gammaproteobacteria bacterium]|nr:GspH/FimT family pseudopilin [Gammaproteobacteria bacterium]